MGRISVEKERALKHGEQAATSDVLPLSSDEQEVFESLLDSLPMEERNRCSVRTGVAILATNLVKMKELKAVLEETGSFIQGRFGVEEAAHSILYRKLQSQTTTQFQKLKLLPQLTHQEVARKNKLEAKIRAAGDKVSVLNTNLLAG